MQHVIDLTKKSNNPIILVYKDNSYSAVGIIERQADNHEKHFGVNLKSINGNNLLTVDTVEHAEKLIEALQLAINEGWLFNEKTIKLHCTKA